MRPKQSVLALLLDVLQFVVCWLLRRTGKVPQHVAFIMDGNRRFSVDDKNKGHLQGYQKMIEAVKWCMDLGVPYISVYAFSIENFKRSEQEVSFLMHLARDKYKELMQEGSFAFRNALEIRVLGDLSLAPPDVRDAAHDVMQASRKLKNKKGVLNIMFAYTSTFEMARMVASQGQNGSTCDDLLRQLPARHDAGVLSPTLATSAFKCSCDSCGNVSCGKLLTRGSPDVDILIRTSGETRLSDFMLWQCRKALLVWAEELWPALSFRTFTRAICTYQRHALHLERVHQVLREAAHM